MTQYSEEFKKSIIAKMLPPNNVSVPQLARETGIPKDTLYTWRSKHRKAGDAKLQRQASGELSSEEKFAVVIETASLNEIELGEYCRRKGLYPQQISAWRDTCAQAHHDPAAAQVGREKLRKQTKAIKQLEAELRRKDKALAEAAALLVLQKKVQALWEDPEDGRSGSGSAGK